MMIELQSKKSLFVQVHFGNTNSAEITHFSFDLYWLESILQYINSHAVDISDIALYCVAFNCYRS